MPLYEFFCQPCDGVFEVLRSIKEASEPAPCPVCNRDAPRVMPSSFAAFTYRDGYPRRIPDKGTYWHLGKEVKHLVTGPVRPNEHPEINKPEPTPKPLKGDVTIQREAARLGAEQMAAEEKERAGAIAAYEAEEARKKSAKIIT
jgi:putative FmdB family regulatory protein